MYLRQATASQARLVGPFVDDTDFKTAETGLTIANTDVKLSINGAAGANKNSGGGTHRNNGMYSLTFDATDTATVGELTGSVVVSGALPVFFRFFVVEEAVYDALFAASAPGYVANAPVNVAQFGGSNLTSASGIPEVKVASIANGAIAAATFAANALDAVWSTASRTLTAISDSSGITTLLARIIGTLASGTHNPQSGDAYARLGAPAGASTAADIAAIDAKTTNLPSDPADQSLIIAATNAIMSRLGAPVGADLSADIAALPAAVWASGTRTLSSFGTLVADVATAVWGATTRILTAGTNIALAKGTGVTGFNDITAAAAADAVWDEPIADHAGAGSTGEALSDAGGAGTPPTVIEIRQEMDANSTKLASIDGKTTNLPSDPADQSLVIAATSAIMADLANRATQASVDDLPTNAEQAASFAAADDAVLTQIALVKAKTDLIPTDPAETSDIPSAATVAAAVLAAAASNPIDANVQEINDTALTGDGNSTPWGPAA